MKSSIAFLFPFERRIAVERGPIFTIFFFSFSVCVRVSFYLCIFLCARRCSPLLQDSPCCAIAREHHLDTFQQLETHGTPPAIFVHIKKTCLFGIARDVFLFKSTYDGSNHFQSGKTGLRTLLANLFQTRHSPRLVGS